MKNLTVFSISIFALFTLNNAFAVDYDCYGESLSVSADGQTITYNGSPLTLLQTNCTAGTVLDNNPDLQKGTCFDHGSSELPEGSFNRVIVSPQILSGQKKGDIGLSTYISTADVHVNLVAECTQK